MHYAQFYQIATHIIVLVSLSITHAFRSVFFPFFTVCHTWSHFKCQGITKSLEKSWNDQKLEFYCISCRSNSDGTFDYESGLRRLHRDSKGGIEKLNSGVKRDNLLHKYKYWSGNHFVPLVNTKQPRTTVQPLQYLTDSAPENSADKPYILDSDDDFPSLPETEAIRKPTVGKGSLSSPPGALNAGEPRLSTVSKDAKNGEM
ncbi:hypothetical protein DPMN_054690 [Dreissena polymorpha]|uniref:Uncharacterized protein n=1 Tax=Dreissena polymorpha TaxID=45954 RepID=A0A9D4CQ47_DREPO|nr:hypothetical protein DPMN_054690 [Dreissena polymorpha]